MRMTSDKYLHVIVLGVVIITTQTTSIVSANECQASAIHTDPPNSIGNGCLYPACIPANPILLANTIEWKCVHDDSFCLPDELFVPVNEVLASGRVCSCNNILNFPALIGTCNTNNLYSPMLTVDDCLNGTAVCEKDVSGKFLTGDIQHPFTACDLKCGNEHGHEIVVPRDTYKSYSFPKFDWTVASKSKFYNLQAHQHEIVDDKLYIGGTIEVLKECYDKRGLSRTCPLRNLLKGPFNASNPASVDGTYIVDTKSINPVLANNCAIAIVDKNTGEPMDLFTLYGNGTCHIDSMANSGQGKGSNGKAIIAGGYHNAGILAVNTTGKCISVPRTFGGASTMCKKRSTIARADRKTDTAFVFLMDTEIRNVRWLIQPWLEFIDKSGINLNSYNTSVTDLSLDNNGDVYISGYRDELALSEIVEGGIGRFVLVKKTYGMISKHSGIDGSIIWEEEFLEAKDIRLVQEGEALYITLQMPRSTGTSVLGITCNPPTLPAALMCNVLARISSSDMSLHWARYAYGMSHDKTNSGEVKLAHPDDGPYVYATFSSGMSSNLDLGTPYSGCRSKDGSITIEIDPSFFNLKAPLNPTECTAYGRGDYFDRTSEYALPADFSHSRAQCRWNHSGQHCLVKYHKLTGLPIWGSVAPLSQDFQPLADGIVMIGSKYGPVVFDTVKVSAPDSSVGGHSMAYQSKIDLDGAGVYVQSIIAHESSATATSLTQDPDTGDIYIGFLTKASKTYLGPGAPVGFTQDLILDEMCKDAQWEGDTLCTEVSRLSVAKLGVEEKPSCIDTVEWMGKTLIKAGMCFIDNVCYKNEDTGARIGLPCHVCSPSISQTMWMDDVDDFCAIDGKCYKAGARLTVFGTRSVCQTCLPKRNSQAWSLEHGYESTFYFFPPDDCIPAAPTVLTYAPTPASMRYDWADDVLTYAPTPASMRYDWADDDIFDSFNIRKRQGSDSANIRKGQGNARFVIGLIVFGVAVGIIVTVGICYPREKPEHVPTFVQREANLT